MGIGLINHFKIPCHVLTIQESNPKKLYQQIFAFYIGKNVDENQKIVAKLNIFLCLTYSFDPIFMSGVSSELSSSTQLLAVTLYVKFLPFWPKTKQNK